MVTIVWSFEQLLIRSFSLHSVTPAFTYHLSPESRLISVLQQSYLLVPGSLLIDLILLFVDSAHVLLVMVTCNSGFLFRYGHVLQKAFQTSLSLLPLFTPLNWIYFLYQEVDSQNYKHLSHRMQIRRLQLIFLICTL